MNKQIIINLIIGVSVGVLAFIGGLKYAEMNPAKIAPSQYGQGNFRMMQNGSGSAQKQTGTRMGFRPIFGEVLSIDENTMTVKLSDGSTKIVVLTDKSAASTQTEVKISDIKEGTKVSVMGAEGEGNTITAQSIVLNPVTRNMPQVTGLQKDPTEN